MKVARALVEGVASGWWPALGPLAGGSLPGCLPGGRRMAAAALAGTRPARHHPHECAAASLHRAAQTRPTLTWCCGPQPLCCCPCSSTRPPSAPSCAGPGSGACAAAREGCAERGNGSRHAAVLCCGGAGAPPAAGGACRQGTNRPRCGRCPPPPWPCSHISAERMRGRRRALDQLRAMTAESIAELKQQQDGEFLQGARGWAGVLAGWAGG